MEKSQFLLTFADVSQVKDLFRGEFLKGHREPRIAMVGRSNVGKSTLINALLENRLAQTSRNPGKTKAIHFYLWTKGSKIIADLPGYGFARSAQSERKRWEELIDLYFRTDSHLERALLLLDARHGPTEVDWQAIEFLSLRRIPVTFIFVKSDTLKTQSQRAQRNQEVQLLLQRMKADSSQVFWVSSRRKTGLKELSKALSTNWS